MPNDFDESENLEIKIALAASAETRSKEIRAKVSNINSLLRKVLAGYEDTLDERGTVSGLVNRVFDAKYTKLMWSLNGIEDTLKEIAEANPSKAPSYGRR